MMIQERDIKTKIGSTERQKEKQKDKGQKDIQ